MTHPVIDVEYDFPSSVLLGEPVPNLRSADEMSSVKRRVESLSHRIARSEALLGEFASEANASLAELFPVVQSLAAASLRERPSASPNVAFPSGIEHILHEMSSRADQLDGLHVDDSAALSELKQETLQTVTGRLAENSNAARVANIAYVLASAQVRRLRFVGGCPRAMRGCPLGWTGHGGACSPPSDYDGWCGDVGVDQMSASEKEEFAWKCGASWPCETCRTHFDGCPAGWLENAGLCLAPPEYDGICSPVMDFSTFSVARMAEWSAMCSARWPCAV